MNQNRNSLSGKIHNYRSVDEKDIKLLRKLVLYLIHEASVLFELNAYKPSMVASSCILAARKIMKFKEVWSKNLQNITKYEHMELMKCTTVLLDNYNNITVGKVTMDTKDLIGVQPVRFESSIKHSNSFIEFEPYNIEIKKSVSPIKSREMELKLPLGSKSRSHFNQSASIINLKTHKANSKSIICDENPLYLMPPRTAFIDLSFLATNIESQDSYRSKFRSCTSNSFVILNRDNKDMTKRQSNNQNVKRSRYSYINCVKSTSKNHQRLNPRSKFRPSEILNHSICAIQNEVKSRKMTDSSLIYSKIVSKRQQRTFSTNTYTIVRKSSENVSTDCSIDLNRTRFQSDDNSGSTSDQLSVTKIDKRTKNIPEYDNNAFGKDSGYKMTVQNVTI